MEKIKKFWDSLDGLLLVRKRELLLGAALCAMTGLCAGMLLSPKKTVVYGPKPEKPERKREGKEEK